MRAIDLYSGVGGWAVGLNLAGMEIVASYEISAKANETNQRNNHHSVFQTDIRKLQLSELPSGISAVVGSPPCTQFSFSNRGGGGDLADGLMDVRRFFQIVDHLKPAVWAMENVPRLAKILDEELRPGGELAEFRHLGMQYEVFDLQQFGVPQKRLRCIVGNFNFELLRAYRDVARRRTLRMVIDAISGDPVVDPNYGYSCPAADVVDHYLEESLNVEEVRINRSLKALHPIYNSMHFPDCLDRPARTITATCTRVSRESIVIASPEKKDNYRRLTVRERAACQSFPIGFQFYANSYSDKLRMVGNAVPPLFAFYVAQAMQGIRPEDLKQPTINTAESQFGPPATTCRPDRRLTKYRQDRSFQFAVPSLRLGSGVRFELSNGSRSGQIDWHLRFVFGTSKSIQALRPNRDFDDFVLGMIQGEAAGAVSETLTRFASEIRKMDFGHLQAVWSHRGPGATRPFMLLDLIDDYSSALQVALMPHRQACITALRQIADTLGAEGARHLNSRKLSDNAEVVVAGLLVGAIANREIMEIGAARQTRNPPAPARKVG